MKKLLALIMLFVLAVNVSAATKKGSGKSASKKAAVSSADATRESKLISVNPFGMLFGVLNGQYEWKIRGSERTALINASFWSWGIGDWKITGIGAGVGMNMFPRKGALSGFFWGPRAEIDSISAKYTYLEFYRTSTYSYGWREVESKDSSIFFGLGVTGGYRWVWDGGFSLDLTTGFRYMMGSIEIADSTVPISGFGWGGLGLGLGYAF